MKTMLILLIVTFLASPLLDAVSSGALKVEPSIKLSHVEHRKMMHDTAAASAHDCCESEVVSMASGNSAQASSEHDCEGQCGDCQQQCHSASTLVLNGQQLLIPPLLHAETGYLFQPFRTDLEPTQKPPMPA